MKGFFRKYFFALAQVEESLLVFKTVQHQMILREIFVFQSFESVHFAVRIDRGGKTSKCQLFTWNIILGQSDLQIGRSLSQTLGEKKLVFFCN